MRVAVSMTAGTPPNRDIWVIDERMVSSRLTTDPGVEANPAWSPDGKRIAFVSTNPKPGLHVANASGGAGEEQLVAMDGIGAASDWSRDGRYIAYWNVNSKTAGDLWLVPVAGDHKPLPFATSTFEERDAAFSPDTRWIAYASDESGHMEVYVQPFPQTGDKYKISSAGGEQPLWRADGKELFFLSPNAMLMAVSIETDSNGQSFVPGAARPLFASGILMSNRRQYAPSRDGERFLLNSPGRRSNPTPLVVTLNWRPTGHM